jgi:large repetitive protein
MSSTSHGFRWVALWALVLSACGGGSDSGVPAGSDTIAPDTELVSSPTPRTNSTVLSFVVTSNEAGVVFEARADGSFFTPVLAAFSLSGLGDGPHRIEIRARDAAGNVDASPLVFDIVIDRVPPDTMISSGPPATSASPSATFSFMSEANASFEASLDGAPFAFAPTPLTIAGLAPGPHSLNVRAMDAAGNVDPSPAAYSWTVVP